LGVQEDENIKDPLKGVRTIAHNKIMIIDGKTLFQAVLTLLKRQKQNAKNLPIIQSLELAKLYIENWKHHKEHSEPYAPRD
jgi:hypothetical protein